MYWMVWLVIVAVLMWFLLNRHKFGANIYLIGDNVKSAELMGINTGRTRIMAFVLVGLVSALAGVLASLYVTYFWPSLARQYPFVRNSKWLDDLTGQEIRQVEANLAPEIVEDCQKSGSNLPVADNLITYFSENI